MIERLRAKLWRLRQSIKPQRRKQPAAEPIRGHMQNVIIIKPQNKMFSQAMFVLSDDYLRQSRLSSQELLRQAREAAGDYGGSLMPRREGRAGLWALLLILAGAALLGAGCFFIFAYSPL